MTNVPAGWYPSTDPNKPNILQWWDGTAWTEYEHTDFSGLIPERIGKREARETIVQMQQSIRALEDVINRHGLRKYEDFTVWRQERIDALNKYEQDIQQELSRLKHEKDALQSEVSSLRSEIVTISQTRDFQEVGLFDYEHPAEMSVKLATELESVRSKIKNAIRDKQATTSLDGFTFNGSLAQGKKLSNGLTKLLLRAYNAEAENAIKTTKAGNLATAQSRLSRAADQIAKSGSMIELRITDYFHRLRLQEIELAHRHLKALQHEKELERERRAELREQKKAEAELKREQERLEKEKSHYEATLSALRTNGDTEGVERMLAKIEDVQRAIQDVDYRAANMRAGYVYVISNIGSFGPDVVKIGMTRRLDPMDRVRELGDASVPFRFDVHALFFADDAVSIENMLHKEFAHCRVNQVNLRREYFQTTPQEVLDSLQAHQVEVLEFTVTPEAEEYNESISIREAINSPALT